MKTSVLSTIALLCGVLGLCFSCIFIGVFPAIAGVILGIIALNDDSAYKWPSICAIACSSIGIMMAIVVMTQSPEWNTPTVATPTEMVENLTNPKDETSDSQGAVEPKQNTEEKTVKPSPKKENNSGVIYSDENVIISYEGLSGNEEEYGFKFDVENLSGRNLIVSTKDVVANGYTLSEANLGHSCYIQIVSGNKAKGDLNFYTIFDDMIPRKNDLNSLKIKFHIMDENDWDYQYDSQEITLK